MTDFTSKATSAYLSASFVPNGKVRLFGTLSYMQSKAALDEVKMPDVTDQLDGDLTHQDFTFAEMHTYSDLDYKLIKINAGIEYRLTPTVVWTIDGDYADLTDNQGYVYGNESGSFVIVRTGLRLEL